MMSFALNYVFEDLSMTVYGEMCSSYGHYISEKYGLPGEVSEERIKAGAIVKYGYGTEIHYLL